MRVEMRGYRVSNMLESQFIHFISDIVGVAQLVNKVEGTEWNYCSLASFHLFLIAYSMWSLRKLPSTVLFLIAYEASGSFLPPSCFWLLTVCEASGSFIPRSSPPFHFWLLIECKNGEGRPCHVCARCCNIMIGRHMGGRTWRGISMPFLFKD